MAFPVRTMTRSSFLSGETNGKLDESILTRVPGQAGGATVTLIAPAARAWRALTAAALKAGHVLKTGWPSSSYRTYAEQERIFRDRYTRTYLPGRPYKMWQGRRWYQRPGTAVAAVPGTSNHGWACAVDGGEERDSDVAPESFDDATLRWLVAHEQTYGWSHEVQSEPWHIRYFAGDDIPDAVLAYERSLQPAPLPPQQEEDIVYRLARIKGKDRPSVLYRVLFDKNDIPVEAWDVPGDPNTPEGAATHRRWRERLGEPVETVYPANTFIVIWDGPYKNVS